MIGQGRIRAALAIAVGLASLAAAPAGAAERDLRAEGEIIADSGFRAPENGYGFPNYGGEPGVTNLRAGEMRKLFGDAACAATVEGRCILTPAAAAWMEQTNAGMDGGHCFGMAYTAQRWYERIGEPPTPEPFGSPTVPGLVFDGNADLQSHIAADFSLQYVPAVRNRWKGGSPTAVLEILTRQLRHGVTPYALLIFDQGGGHAITPVAVSKLGRSTFRILVYDNNHPDQTRAVVVDAEQNTWRYVLGADRSSLWSGDATTETMALSPISAGLGVQRCRFCGDDPKAAPTKRRGLEGDGRVELRWNADPSTGGHGSLFVTDEEGGRAGCGADGCVDGIEGGELFRPIVGPVKPWTLQPPPVFDLPGGRSYVATLSGGSLEEPAREGIELIGRGFTAGVQGIALRPGERDQLRFSDDAHRITFDNDPQQTETPSIELSTATADADFAFSVGAAGIRGGAQVSFALDPAASRLTIDPSDRDGRGRFTISMTRTTGAGSEVLSDQVEATSGERVEIDYGAWQSDDQPVPVEG